MAGTATPPPAPPAAPTAPPSAPPASPAPPAATPPAPFPSPDNDPNLAMTQLVNKSREKNKSGAPATPPTGQKSPETPPSEPPGAGATPPATPPAEPQKLTNLLGKALKFTQKPGQTTDPAAPPATLATPASAPAAPAAASAAPPAEPSTKKGSKGKKAPPTVDPVAVASAAATAATEAVMRTVQTNAAPPKVSPSDNLSDDDKRDYEVALHLASLDPRYADAPKIILDHVARAEDYAARWEAANPGKEFNASDEEHDDFFATLQRPWTANDFNEAKIDLAADKKLKKFQEEQQGSMQGLHENQAHIELAPAVDRKFTEATTELARAVGDEVHKILTTTGWDGLHKSDPVTAQVLATTLDQLHPFIEAAIEIDEPRRRVRVNTNNPAHAQWNQVVSTGEARLVGTQIEDGRMFAKRADYVRMTQAQQSAHWYLTTDMIIEGALDYAADQVKKVAESQKERLKSLGFVRQDPAAGGAQATPAPSAAAPAPSAAPADKPISPTVGSGAKIDAPNGAPKSGEGALMQEIRKILRGK